ncbi:hypothetical protein Tco_1162703, partial [Tanacetum coccineum]
MFADTPYPLSAQLMKKMLKHKLEVEIDEIGNDMTYAEQLIQFIKNQSFGFHLSFVKLVVNGFWFLEYLGFDILFWDWITCPRLDADFLVADSKFMKVAFGVGFKMIVVPSSGIVTTSRYVVPTGRVKVPAGRYVVPTGKDNVIVSAGRTKVIPAGRTILVLVGSVEGSDDSEGDDVILDGEDEGVGEAAPKSLRLNVTNSENSDCTSPNHLFKLGNFVNSCSEDVVATDLDASYQSKEYEASFPIGITSNLAYRDVLLREYVLDSNTLVYLCQLILPPLDSPPKVTNLHQSS